MSAKLRNEQFDSLYISPLRYASPNTLNPSSYALIATSSLCSRLEALRLRSLLLFPSTSLPLFFHPPYSPHSLRFLLYYSLKISRTHPTPSIRIQEVGSLGRLPFQIDPLFPYFHRHYHLFPLWRMDPLYNRRFDGLQHGLDGQVQRI